MFSSFSKKIRSEVVCVFEFVKQLISIFTSNLKIKIFCSQIYIIYILSGTISTVN